MQLAITIFKMIGAATTSFFWGAVTFGAFLVIGGIGVIASIVYLVKVFS